MIEKIKEIITDITAIDIEEICDNSNLRTDLELSSLDLINLAVELEKKFSINVSDKEIISQKQFSDIIELVRKKAICV